MTDIRSAIEAFREALSHLSRGPEVPQPVAQVIEKGESLLGEIEKAQATPAATACSDHLPGETGYVAFGARVPHGAPLFHAPPPQAGQ